MANMMRRWWSTRLAMTEVICQKFKAVLIVGNLEKLICAHLQLSSKFRNTICLSQNLRQNYFSKWFSCICPCNQCNAQNKKMLKESMDNVRESKLKKQLYLTLQICQHTSTKDIAGQSATLDTSHLSTPLIFSGKAIEKITK